MTICDRQREVFVKNDDSQSSGRCQKLNLECYKFCQVVKKSLESGKISPQDYLNI